MSYVDEPIDFNSDDVTVSDVCVSIQKVINKKFEAGDLMTYKIVLKPEWMKTVGNKATCYNRVIFQMFFTIFGPQLNPMCYAIVEVVFSNGTSSTSGLKTTHELFNQKFGGNLSGCREEQFDEKFCFSIFLMNPIRQSQLTWGLYLAILEESCQSQDKRTLLKKIQSAEMAVEEQLNPNATTRNRAPRTANAATSSGIQKEIVYLSYLNKNAQDQQYGRCKGELAKACICRRLHISEYASVSLLSTQFYLLCLFARRWKVSVKKSFFENRSDKPLLYSTIAHNLCLSEMSEHFSHSAWLKYEIFTSDGRVFKADPQRYHLSDPQSLTSVLFPQGANNDALTRKFTVVAYVIIENEFVNDNQQRRVVDGFSASMLEEVKEDWDRQKQAAETRSIEASLNSTKKKANENTKQIQRLLISAIQEKVEKSAPGLLTKLRTQNPSGYCESHELLQFDEFDASVCARFRVELQDNFKENNLKKAELTYSLVCYELFLKACGTRGFNENSYLCFVIEEDGGYIISTGVRIAADSLDKPEITFSKNIKLRKLKGKGFVNVLLIHGDDIGSQSLCEKFVANINKRLSMTADESTFLEKVKKAGEWLASLNAQAGMQNVENTVKKNTTGQTEFVPEYSAENGADVTVEFSFHNQELDEYSDKYLTIGRWFYEMENDVFPPTLDREMVYCQQAAQLYEEHYTKFLKPGTQTMVEFRAQDGTVFTTKLGPQELQNSVVMASAIRQHCLPNSTLDGTFILSIIMAHRIDPDLASENATHLVNLLRKSCERNLLLTMYFFSKKHKDLNFKQSTIDFEECKNAVDYSCSCKKFHLRDICTIEPEKLAPQSEKRVEHKRWICTWREPNLAMLDAPFLFGQVANRLCLNEFSDKFNAGTHALYTIGVGGSSFETELTHWLDLTVENIVSQLYACEDISINKKIAITVAVVDTLEYDSKEEALKAIKNISFPKKDASKVDTKSIRPQTAKEIKYFEPVESTTKQRIEEFHPNCGKLPCTTMDSSHFKENSSLHTKALSSQIPVRDAYTRISNKSTVLTDRSKIYVLDIRVKKEFLEDCVNKQLLISNVCLNIVNDNGASLRSLRKLRTIIKLELGEQILQAVLKDSAEWDPQSLKQQLFKEMSIHGSVPAEFRLEIHYRLAK